MFITLNPVLMIFPICYCGCQKLEPKVEQCFEETSLIFKILKPVSCVINFF
jgi:hypothetical protein